TRWLSVASEKARAAWALGKPPWMRNGVAPALTRTTRTRTAARATGMTASESGWTRIAGDSASAASRRKKTRYPTKTAATAVTSTAPAATFFAVSARGWYSFVTRSTADSTAVL